MVSQAKSINKQTRGFHAAFAYFIWDMIIFDLWVIMKLRKISKLTVKLCWPVIKVLFYIIFGAGMATYFENVIEPANSIIDGAREPSKCSPDEALILGIMTSMKITILNYNEFLAIGQLQSNRPRMLLTMTDSLTNNSLLVGEIARLKNKASKLESMLQRINSQFAYLYMRQKLKDDVLPDFASEAAGGSVISTPDTEPYFDDKNVHATLFGVPIWKPNYYTPRKVIQPWSQAGECWAFKGSHGKIEIRLAHAAKVQQVTLEHIPATASFTGNINSAPRNFRILGNFRGKYVILDSFSYDVNGLSSQLFYIRDHEMRDIPVKQLLLEVLSNWGNPEFTCIYRFKVHGKIFKVLEDDILNDEVLQ